MNGAKSVYRVDTGSCIEETRASPEIEVECRHMKVKWVKAKSFHLKMCVQERGMSMLSYPELKGFEAGHWGSCCNSSIQKAETGGLP